MHLGSSGPWMVDQEHRLAPVCLSPEDKNRWEGRDSTQHLVLRAPENRHRESQQDSYARPHKALSGAVDEGSGAT